MKIHIEVENNDETTSEVFNGFVQANEWLSALEEKIEEEKEKRWQEKKDQEDLEEFNDYGKPSELESDGLIKIEE